MIKSFRYRIYPTKKQITVLESQLAICAELYNAALQERREAWQCQRKSVSYFDQTKQLTQIKPIRDDVAKVNSNALENVLKRVDLAFKAFYRRVRQGEAPGYPRFRSARRYGSLTYRQIGNALCDKKLRLPGIGVVRVRQHRPLTGIVKTLTVKRSAGRWFAVFTVECESVPLPFCANVIGVDVGLNSFAAISTGETIPNPRYYREAERRLRVAQRRVSRRKRGSNRRRKAIQLLQRVCARARNQRADFLHNLSTRLVRENGLIAVEDLNIQGLAKGRLSKSVHDAAWGIFFFMLSYKAEWADRILIKVDPRGTSQTCICGAVARKTLNDRVHVCLSCGLSADRDHVSSLIILSRAERLQALTSPVAECVA